MESDKISCPKCGKGFMKVEGKQLVCSCGYVETVKMVDAADQIEKFEDEIWQLIYNMRKTGVRFSVVHTIFQETLKTLEIQSYADDWLNQHNKPK